MPAPPSHRNGSSSRSGVPHGLFSFRTVTPNGAPVFRSAYSASRNARASAAFAASIEAHCAVCRETLMLQVRCAHPAPSHRNVPSGHSGVTVGLFSTKSTQYSLLQNARPSGSLREPYGYRGAKLRVLMPPLYKGRCRTDEGRLTEGFPLSREITLGTTTPQSACASQLPPCAPKRLFKPFRCYGRLIFRKEYTVLFAPKRSTSRFAARTLRGTSHRNDPSGRSGVAHGLFSEKSILCSFLQNAHASGSLRSPYG